MARYKKRKNVNFKVVVIGVVVALVVIIGGVMHFVEAKAKDKPIDNTKTLENNQNVQNQDQKSQNKEVVTGNKYGYPEQGSNIIESAKSYAVPANQVFTMLNSKARVNNEKEVFLTFDDGPSQNTPKILKILKQYGVHATFFALGSNLENSSENREYLKEIYESGNAIANHTYSHNFHKLYPSNNVNVNVFMKEIAETDKIMRNILGDNFNTRVLRMPGGYMSRVYYHDKNLNALKEALKETGVVSIDWDAETGDATGNGIAPNRLINTAIKESANKEHVVLLMHDAAAKKTTVEALPKLIEYYKNQGYAFKVISNPEQTNSEQTNSDQ